MPRLWILSDLHLESVASPEAFRPDPPPFDVLVAAGDIWQGQVGRALAALTRLARGRPAVFVMGNHEYWRQSFHDVLAEARRLAAQHGVALLEGEEAEICGVRFIGATLWSDDRLSGFAPRPDRANGEPIEIREGERRRAMTFGDATNRHLATLRVFRKLLARPRDRRPVVVVTHYPPLSVGTPPSAGGLVLAGRGAADLSRLTDSGSVDLWIHGHVHVSVDTTRPGGARILCNPAGLLFENPDFRADLVVDVDAGARNGPVSF